MTICVMDIVISTETFVRSTSNLDGKTDALWESYELGKFAAAAHVFKLYLNRIGQRNNANMLKDQNPCKLATCCIAFQIHISF